MYRPGPGRNRPYSEACFSPNVEPINAEKNSRSNDRNNFANNARSSEGFRLKSRLKHNARFSPRHTC